MKSVLALAVIVSLALSLFTPTTILRAAPGDITVISSSQVNKFPNEIVFHLEAKSSSDIKKVTLFYKVGSASVLSYAYPSITSGKSVSTDYSLNTQKTYIPPTTDVSYQWQIDDDSGNSLKTDFTTFGYEDVRFKWNKLTREGLTIYWYKGSQSFANELLNAALAAIKRLTTEVGITYEHPIRVVVYDTKSDMDPAIPKRSDTYSRETTILGVQLSSEVLALLGGYGEAKNVVAHELSHMVIHQLVDNPYGDIPGWLDEGLAMIAQGDLTEEFKQALDEGVRRNDLISVRSMTSYSGDPGKVNLYYGESYSVVKYLMDSYGRDKMTQLLKVFKEGTSTDDALHDVYGFTMDELDAKWRASLGLPARQGRDNTAQPGVTPIPTIVPFGTSGPPDRVDFVRLLTWVCIPVLLCSVVLLLAVLVVIVFWRRRR